MSVIAIDPGESIGFIWHEDDKAWGATLTGDWRLKSLWDELNLRQPETIVYEEFALRQSAAQKLIGNKFITCEVIGVIKLWAQLHFGEVRLIPLIPLSKEYCGFGSNPKDDHYKNIQMMYGQKITEHTRDAYRLYSYAKLFKGVQNG